EVWPFAPSRHTRFRVCLFFWVRCSALAHIFEAAGSLYCGKESSGRADLSDFVATSADPSQAFLVLASLAPNIGVLVSARLPDLGPSGRFPNFSGLKLS